MDFPSSQGEADGTGEALARSESSPASVHRRRTLREALMVVIIYHNPGCRTSRNTLALIRNAGVKPHVTEPLKTPPSRALLVQLIARMGMAVQADSAYLPQGPRELQVFRTGSRRELTVVKRNAVATTAPPLREARV
jgi:hypothetical protein